MKRLGLHMSQQSQSLSKDKHSSRPQSFYRFFKGLWQISSTAVTSEESTSMIRLISWNIDSQAPGGPLRMAAALRYLEQLVDDAPSSIPVVIFLQEMTPSDLRLIQAAHWVRDRFSISDLDGSSWQSPFYGTTTLVDHKISIRNVYRVYLKSKMQRDGLFVDILTKAANANSDSSILRLCNTHLESLVAEPPLRPAQISIISEQLHESSIQAGLVAGDFNAIEPFDRSLHDENDLRDAFLELGGQEDSEEGYTWGQQVYADLREQFGCCRMDKILCCGGIRIEGLQRIGINIKVEESQRQRMRKWGALEYVTDHVRLSQMGLFPLPIIIISATRGFLPSSCPSLAWRG